MRAIVVEQEAGERVLREAEVEPPAMIDGGIRIAVTAAGVNRADLLQRRGLYPPPAGASEVLGLECAGIVSEVSPGLTRFRVGDRVMALLAGGGYADEVVVDAGCAMTVPGLLSLEEAAGLPETFLTVYLTVFELAGLRRGGTVLVHGGGSGIGTAAISMVAAHGGRTYVTAGSDEKCRRCEALGASAAFNYREEDFAPAIRHATSGRGVDVVLDPVGGPYLAANLECLALDGALVVIATMGGSSAELDLRTLMRKRARIIGSTLRARPAEQKAALVAGFEREFGAALAAGALRPVIDSVVPLAEANAAHLRMEASDHFGKIVLRLG